MTPKITTAFGLLLFLTLPSTGWTSENVPLDDPAYLEVEKLIARGGAPSSVLSGMRPLSAARLEAMTLQAGPAPRWELGTGAGGAWVRPVGRLATRLSLLSSDWRAYSTTARARSMAGQLVQSCEHQEGRPCEGTLGAMLELDSAAGWGRFATVATRLRMRAADEGEAAVDLDRAYVSLEWGPVLAEAGRDVIVVGPGRRTQLAFGDQAPPLDHLRLQVAAIPIPGLPLSAGALYVVGRLANPQRFPGTWLTIARAYLEIADTATLALTNLLEMGGDGAPPLTFPQFLAEHVRRGGSFPSEGFSNRRVAFDGTLAIRPLKSILYVELAFEDWRKQIVSAFRHDADYLVGWSSPSLGREGRLGLLLELTKTGVRSQEHGLFASGMTSGGRVLGHPLGPDAFSVFVSPRIDVGRTSLWPWFELARLGSDRYDFPEEAAITRISSELVETRLRLGMRVQTVIHSGLWFTAEGFGERIENFSFRPDDTRLGGGIRFAAIWRGAAVSSPPQTH